MKPRLQAIYTRVQSILACPERLFLALAAPFGLVFLVLLAPFQAPDEYAHFYHAYSIASGRWLGQEFTLPQSVMDFSQTVAPDLAGNDQNRQSKRVLLDEFSRKFEALPETRVIYPNAALYSPLPYLPQAVGIGVGRALRLSPILIFYLARLCNLAAWLGLTYLALRSAPIHRRLLAALALMPMTLHQAASVSPDALTIALSFLFIAQALRLLLVERPGLERRDWALMALLSVGLALCKSVYILAAGLLVLAAARRARRMPLPAAAAPALVVMALGLLVGLGWMQYVQGLYDEAAMNELHMPTTWGVRLLLTHPLENAGLVWQAARQNSLLELQMFIGVLGWADTPLPAWVYGVVCGLLLAAAMLEPRPAGLGLHTFERLWIAAMALGNSLLMTGLFIFPDESGAGRVDLIQGRYFIPLAALYLLPLSQRRWSVPNHSWFWPAAGLLHALVLLAAARALLYRYFNI